MSYTQFDATKPDGADSGPQIPDTANANDKALRDAIMMGQMPGFAFSCSGGTARQPATMLWTNGATILKAALTWGSSGGSDYNVTAVTWSLSTNGGGAYDAIEAQTFTYDSNGNLTATANAGGFGSWLMSLIGRIGVVEAEIVALLADNAALGTMSTQNANAVAITDGSAQLTYEREKISAIGNLNASHAIDWTAQGVVTVTVTGSSAAFTYSNLPSGGNGGMAQALLFKVTNGGLATSLFGSAKKPAGFSLSSGATDWVSVVCVDGTTPEVVGVTKNVS
jgi:hypothetical protein